MANAPGNAVKFKMNFPVMNPVVDSDWDPTQPESNATVDVLREIPPQFANRINRDIKAFFTDPIPDIMLYPDTDNMLIAHAIIIGPEDTPYEGGFFYFYIKLPHNYPFSPPMMKLMTTGQNTVRFNPNLYSNGKVCLSLLNTWTGPQWSAGSTLSSVLVSVQSIMNKEPFYNEPGAHVLKFGLDPVKQYNDIIRHETIRVAVIDMVEDKYDSRNMPSVLKEYICQYFKTKISYYDKVINSNIQLDGQLMQDPFREERGKFRYRVLRERMDKLKEKYLTNV